MTAPALEGAVRSPSHRRPCPPQAGVWRPLGKTPALARLLLTTPSAPASGAEPRLLRSRRRAYARGSLPESRPLPAGGAARGRRGGTVLMEPPRLLTSQKPLRALGWGPGEIQPRDRREAWACAMASLAILALFC